MRRKFCLFAALALLLCLVACSNNSNISETSSLPVADSQETASPAIIATMSAEDLCGNQVDDVLEILRDAGFLQVNCLEQADLTVEDKAQEGLVTAVSVNGITDFESGTEFPTDASVVVTYRTITKAIVPISADVIQNYDPAEIESFFAEAGFINIRIEEVLDLDPDEVDVQYVNEMSVSASSAFEQGEVLPYDAEISFIIHRPYEKYTLDIDITFMINLLFNRYGIVVYMGDEEIENLAHGEDATFSFRVKEGTYTFTFVSTDSSNLKEKLVFDVSSDIEAEYKLYCYRDRIELDQTYFDRKIELAENQVKVPASASVYNYGYNYQDVISELTEAGFTNIKTNVLYDIFWGWTDEGEVESVTIDGSSSFTRGNIFEADAEVIITYHMPEEDDPSRIPMAESSSSYVGMDYKDVEQIFRNLGFTNISLYSTTTEDTAYVDGEVYSVKASYGSFSAGDTFEPDDNVSIRYYIVEEPVYISMPHETNAYIGMDYQKVQQSFKELGFSDIELKETTTSDNTRTNGSVFDVTADGQAIQKGVSLEEDTTICIKYYIVKESETSNVLTIENNKDLAELLTAGHVDIQEQEEFISKYRGKIIEFDCVVLFLEHYKDYKTRYNYILVPGQDSENIGAVMFYLEDIGMSDFHWDSATRPDSLTFGSKIRIRATVQTGSDSMYIYLDPVCTWGR